MSCGWWRGTPRGWSRPASVVGVVAAAATAETLSRVVATASRPDLATVTAAVIAFAVVAAVAALVPCRRALAVDPAVTLKAE